MGSNYALAGAPGWTNASTPLTPHPDWYTTVRKRLRISCVLATTRKVPCSQVLWKQLMGHAVLNASLSGDASLAPNVTLHAWCSSSQYAGLPGGSVSLAWVNANLDPVELEAAPGAQFSLAPREEFVMTPVSNETAWTLDVAAARRNANVSHMALPALPAALWNDAAFLNGAALAVDADTGLLPTWPGRIPGRVVSDSSKPLVLPPLSYGFIILPAAAAAACSEQGQ
jgi:hypothetical protein